MYALAGWPAAAQPKPSRLMNRDVQPSGYNVYREKKESFTDCTWHCLPAECCMCYYVVRLLASNPVGSQIAPQSAQRNSCDGRKSASHHGIEQGNAALVWQQPRVGPLATEAATASVHGVRCSAAPSLHDRRIEPCGSDAEAASSRCRALRHSPRKHTTPPRRVKRAAEVSASPHRYRLRCCDIAATAGARHIMVAGRRPEGFRCSGFGGHLTAPRTSATPVSACTEVLGWLGGGRASRARHVGPGW